MRWVTTGAGHALLTSMIRALLALAAITVLTLRVLSAEPAVQSPPPFPDPSLALAREALLSAQQQLRLSSTGKPDEYGGHRKLALELVNTALEQVDAGIKVAAEEAARREQAAKKAPPGRKRRR
jgi:hypothetical protein